MVPHVLTAARAPYQDTVVVVLTWPGFTTSHKPFRGLCSPQISGEADPESHRVSPRLQPSRPLILCTVPRPGGRLTQQLRCRTLASSVWVRPSWSQGHMLGQGDQDTELRPTAPGPHHSLPRETRAAQQPLYPLGPRGGKEHLPYLGDGAHGLSAAFPEHQPLVYVQVLGRLDEAEVHSSLVPGAQTVLVHAQDGGCLPDAPAVHCWGSGVGGVVDQLGLGGLLEPAWLLCLSWMPPTLGSDPAPSLLAQDVPISSLSQVPGTPHGDIQETWKHGRTGTGWVPGADLNRQTHRQADTRAQVWHRESRKGDLTGGWSREAGPLA